MSLIDEVTVAIPLPRFRRPQSDPPLPEVDNMATESPSSDEPPRETSDRPQPSSPDDDPAPPPVLSPGPLTRTGISSRSKNAGDPKVAGEVFAGLIAIVCLWAYTVAGRRGRHFRQPTEPQVDDIARPLGRIAARYLPTELINDTLVDATHAAAGVHRYVIDGPLLTRYDQPIPEDLS